MKLIIFYQSREEPETGFRDKQDPEKSVVGGPHRESCQSEPGAPVITAPSADVVDAWRCLRKMR